MRGRSDEDVPVGDRGKEVGAARRKIPEEAIGVKPEDGAI